MTPNLLSKSPKFHNPSISESVESQSPNYSTISESRQTSLEYKASDKTKRSKSAESPRSAQDEFTSPARRNTETNEKHSKSHQNPISPEMSALSSDSNTVGGRITILHDPLSSTYKGDKGDKTLNTKTVEEEEASLKSVNEERGGEIPMRL
jgi:hypothetical protein